MKAFIVILLIFFSGSFVFSQDDAVIPGQSSSVNQTSDLPKRTLFLNPLGLLQFGPVFGAEFKLGNSNGYLSPHFRYSYLGLLTHLDWEADYLYPSTLAGGLSYRGFIPVSYNNNAFYMGAGLELDKAIARYDEPIGTEKYYLGFNIILNGGYRWRFPSGRFINAGLIFGLANSIYYDVYDIDSYELLASYNETLLVYMAEFSFGWEKN